MRHGARELALLTLGAAVVAGVHGCASARRQGIAIAVPQGWPIARAGAVVTSSFGSRADGSFHQGIDLSAPAGTAVRATADGVVAFAGRSPGYGRTVMIDHGHGLQTRYAHLKRIEVDIGQRVAAGDFIGTVGRSGNASGSHLHYEVLRDGTPVDPRPYLDNP